MRSKLEKQKQILSLLNSKLVMNEDVDFLEDDDQKMSGGQPLSKERLINQIYHFHRSIIQNLNAGLVTIDLKGEITFANKSTARLLGHEIEELLEKNIKNFFHSGEEADKFLNLCAIPGKKIDDWETKFIHKSNKKITVGINAAHLEDVSNNFEGTVLLLRDLTEVYQLRNQVERMERLALLGELSAGIAHEIRNPLAGIKAATQVLEENFSSDDFQFQLIHRIVREVDKANRLLKEFFKFARPAKPKFGFYNLETIIDSVYLLLAPRLKRKGIKFQEDFQGKVPPVYADETQIEQVVLNLFLNALDAIHENGVLKVSTFKKQLANLDNSEGKYGFSDEERYYVVVEVSDNGPGISPENLNKIFNPFFTTKSDGLGLGLSICSRLIEENNGKIDVISQEGQGTTFMLALPAFAHH